MRTKMVMKERWTRLIDGNEASLYVFLCFLLLVGDLPHILCLPQAASGIFSLSSCLSYVS